jgi:hypothetical protein
LQRLLSTAGGSGVRYHVIGRGDVSTACIILFIGFFPGIF